MAFYEVEIDADLEELIPEFIKNRYQDIRLIEKLLEDGNLAEIERLGHSMKGSGGGYGFDHISVLGKEIEDCAKLGEIQKIADTSRQLMDYLDNVKIIYK